MKVQSPKGKAADSEQFRKKAKKGEQNHCSQRNTQKKAKFKGSGKKPKKQQGAPTQTYTGTKKKRKKYQTVSVSPPFSVFTISPVLLLRSQFNQIYRS